jgi:hypothetical protein
MFKNLWKVGGKNLDNFSSGPTLSYISVQNLAVSTIFPINFSQYIYSIFHLLIGVYSTFSTPPTITTIFIIKVSTKGGKA